MTNDRVCLEHFIWHGQIDSNIFLALIYGFFFDEGLEHCNTSKIGSLDHVGDPLQIRGSYMHGVSRCHMYDIRHVTYIYISGIPSGRSWRNLPRALAPTRRLYRNRRLLFELPNILDHNFLKQKVECTRFFSANRRMAGGGGGVGGGRRVLFPPVNFIFKMLQQSSTVQVWLYEQLFIRIEGKIRVSLSQNQHKKSDC